ncbi:MAG: GNAT family N-acetyltransferase [Chitinispirillaceae bacterium]|jgi:hypothetical protein
MTSEHQVRIAACHAARREEWEQTSRACDYATFFHTPIWADIFFRATRGRMVPMAEKVEFSDGTGAVIPMVCKKYLGGCFRLFSSMPAGTFGGWVSSDSLTETHARLLIERLCRIQDLVWRENPYDSVLTRMDVCGAVEDFTQVIDLRQGFPAAEARSDYAHRKAVKKAIEKGVSIAEASNSEQWEKYFLLYRSSRERWRKKKLQKNRGSRGYDWTMFEEIYRSTPEHRRLWLAYVNGTPVAGILCFYWNRHAVAWHGAAAAEYFECRPNNLLYEHAGRHAAGAGYHWFDCNPSGGFKGVVEFKEHLGAQKLRSRVVNRRSMLRGAAELLRGIIP